MLQAWRRSNNERSQNLPPSLTHCIPRMKRVAVIPGDHRLPPSPTHCIPRMKRVAVIPGDHRLPPSLTHCIPRMKRVTVIPLDRRFPPSLTRCIPRIPGNHQFPPSLTHCIARMKRAAVIPVHQLQALTTHDRAVNLPRNPRNHALLVWHQRFFPAFAGGLPAQMSPTSIVGKKYKHYKKNCLYCLTFRHSASPETKREEKNTSIREVLLSEIRMQIFVKLGLRTHERSDEPANRRVVLQTEH